MTRFTTFLLFLVFALSSSAQRLTVESFVVDPMDLSAAAKPVSDLNGKACALVKVQLAVRDAKFEGNIVGDVRNDAGEYWVYMTEGSYWLKVKHADYLPLEVNFRDYGVRRVMSKQTYVLTLLRPDAVPAAAATSSTSSAPTIASASVKPAVSTVGSKLPVPEAVDLGLSVKWASFNLGASKPEETGYYYKWGETEPADDKGWETYKYAKGADDKLTKYCSRKDYAFSGLTDGKKTLEAKDDAATANLGGSWRMPTEKEFKELVKKCKQGWMTTRGVSGILVTGPNGNSIFLPAAGKRDRGDGSYRGVGTLGSYWSASDSDGRYGECLNFNSVAWGWESYDYRATGLPIRPVLGK